MNTSDRIEIPYNEEGKRCIDAFCTVAIKLLDRAREATKEYIFSIAPTAKIVEEKAMCNGKYTAVYSKLDGTQCKAAYDYRTKTVEIER